MSNNFYRYFRNLYYDTSRHKVETSPYGGICLRVENDGYDGTRHLVVSYALCAKDELFDREVAKKIVDTRFATGNVYHITSKSVAANMVALSLVEHYDQLAEAEEPLQLYRYEDLRLFKEQFMKLYHENGAVWVQEKLNHDAIMALNITERYAAKS